MTFTQILAEARRLVKADSTSFTTADITVSANNAQDRVVALIREAEGRWQWDDGNQTDLPIATTPLVANQQDYTLDLTHLELERLERKDSDGYWAQLMPIDPADLYQQSETSFLMTAGVPAYYDKVGSTVKLYPKPDYSQDASLKAYYKRGPEYFLVSDTTKAPGFASLFHRILPLYAAYDFALINQLPIMDDLEKEIFKLENGVVDHYARRDRDDKLQLRTNVHNYR
jgi:hypothetical protein